MRLLFIALFVMTCAEYGQAQTTLTTRVNEVHVLLHAEDGSHQAVRDLQVGDLAVRDAGKRQSRLLSLTMQNDLPLRVGFFFDTSPSMSFVYPVLRSRNIAAQMVMHWMRKGDAMFVQRFDFEDAPSMSFTEDSDVLMRELMRAGEGMRSRAGGTALYDALYRGCRDRFEALADGKTANVMVVFTDGADNASHAYLSEAISECQLARTAVFLFMPSENGGSAKGLKELAERTGGSVFIDQTGDGALYYRGFDPAKLTTGVNEATLSNIDELVRRMRDQYELVYRPEELKADGKFHPVEIDVPRRPIKIVARSGYYAPARAR